MVVRDGLGDSGAEVRQKDFLNRREGRERRGAERQKDFEQERTEGTERELDLCFLCFLM